MNKKNKAFTLIEVMVVVIIVSLLAAFSIPAYQKASRKAQERAAVANLMAIRTGVEFYVTNSGGNIPVWDGLSAINNALGLSLVDNVNTNYHCRPNPADGVNRCRVVTYGPSNLHFHFNGSHNANGSIHCNVGTCPSCPNSPGNCG